MRPVLIAFALLVSGSPGWSQDFARSVDGGDPSVRIYDVAPANAQSLGPVSVLTCGRPVESAKRRLINLVLRQGGNGVSELACSEEGMSFSCWSSAKCVGIALNIPPVISPPPPKPKLKTKKPARVATHAQLDSKDHESVGALSAQVAVKPSDPSRGIFNERFISTR